MGVTVQSLSNIDWWSILYKSGSWIGFVVFAIILGIVFFAVIHFFSFPIKARVYPLFGSAEKGFSVGKAKTNKIRWNKTKTGWVKLFPLFGKNNEIEPFKADYVYPGKEVIAYELENVWIPAKHNVSGDKDDVIGSINPCPHYIRNWQSLTHKKHNMEFADNNWWEQNKMFVYMLIGIGICCTMCAFTIWASYKFATPGIEKMDALTQAITNYATIPSK